MMNRKFYAGLCGAVMMMYSAFFFATTACAAPSQDRGERPKPPSVEEMTTKTLADLKERLTLTGDQEQQLQAALQTYFTQRDELFKQSRPAGPGNQSSGDRPEPPAADGNRPEPPAGDSDRPEPPANGDRPAEPKEMTALRETFEKSAAAFLTEAQVKEVKAYFEEQQKQMRPRPEGKPEQQ